MDYLGVIIAESLEESAILQRLKIVKTEVEPVTEGHKTPWIKQWTMHTVEIPDDNGDAVAHSLSSALDAKHKSSWYIDFKNDKTHFIIFRNKIFKVDRSKPEQYKEVIEYGRKLGIPKHQLDFSPNT